MSRFKTFSAVFATMLCAMSQQTGEASEPIVRIEEDWTVEIGTPDPEKHAPQIVIVFSPSNNLSYRHCLLEVNHRSLPDYQAGGLQLQAWQGDINLDKQSSPLTDVLSNNDETVKFTMRMKVDNGLLTFEVVNGTSETWGPFGNQGNLKSSVATFRTDLSEYSKTTSTTKSKVGFAKHRVKCLKRTAIRYYSATGLVSTDSTATVVHQHVVTEQDE